MAVWDYILPHRLLINRALRKEAQGLHSRIDSFQIEYEKRVEQCHDELQKAKAESEESLEQYKKSLIQALQAEKDTLQEIAQDIILYVENYLQRKYLSLICEIKNQEIQIIEEDVSFLSKQMKIIGKEIAILKSRQDELTSFTNVDDVIQLSSYSDYELCFTPEDDAKSILQKVNEAINSFDSDHKIEKTALVRLRGIVQERSEYLATIQYIGWLIQQKILFSKQLFAKRASIRGRKEELEKDIQIIVCEIQDLSIIIDNAADKIRSFWAKPMAYINADNAYAVQEKRQKRQELQDKIQERKDKKAARQDADDELRRMADDHSSDQYRWNQLKEEKRDLSSKINSLQTEIEDLRSEIDELDKDIKSRDGIRQEWIEKSKKVFALCEHHGAPLGKENYLADEKRIITSRLAVIQGIREEGKKEAEQLCKQQQSEIRKKYNARIAEIEGKTASLEASLEKTRSLCEELEQRKLAAKKELDIAKSNDKRVFFIKIFSETEQVSDAKRKLESERTQLSDTIKQKSALEKQIDQLKKQKEKEEQNLIAELNQCRPVYLKPSVAEIKEEKKLQLRMDAIRKKESGHEDKN